MSEKPSYGPLGSFIMSAVHVVKDIVTPSSPSLRVDSTPVYKNDIKNVKEDRNGNSGKNSRDQEKQTQQQGQIGKNDVRNPKDERNGMSVKNSLKDEKQQIIHGTYSVPSKPNLDNYRTKEHPTPTKKRDPLKYNNVLSDISDHVITYSSSSSFEETGNEIDVSKQGFVCLSTGKVTQSQQTAQPIPRTSKLKEICFFVNATVNEQNHYYVNKDEQQLENMIQILKLLDLSEENRNDEEILDYYLNSSGDIPVICKTRKEHSSNIYFKQCKYYHPTYCSLCVTVCPLCFYLKLKELKHENTINIQSITYQSITNLIQTEEEDELDISLGINESRSRLSTVLSNYNLEEITIRDIFHESDDLSKFNYTLNDYRNETFRTTE